MEKTINIKRVYDKALKKDGLRILVDRLWPRGVSKEDAAVDEWAKLLAPSPALRKWFGHDPGLWQEFQKRYMAELKKNDLINDFTETHNDKKPITLIYAAKDELHNHALVLQYYLRHVFNEL